MLNLIKRFSRLEKELKYSQGQPLGGTNANPVKLGILTTEEITEIKRLAVSRKEPIRSVQRARIIASMLEDLKLYATEAGLKAGFKSSPIGAEWVRRFNKDGLKGLEDQPHRGKGQPTHQKSRMP